MRTAASTLFPALVLGFILSVNNPARAGQDLGPAGSALDCSPVGASFTRTTLYFGLAHPTGLVTEAQWKSFLRNEVTPRFPKGLTVWGADGQWRKEDGRIGRERAKVLLLVHDESPASRAAIQQIVERYKALFRQESVLWETARVCAAF